MINIKIDARPEIPLHRRIGNGTRELISEKRCRPKRRVPSAGERIVGFVTPGGRGDIDLSAGQTIS